MKIDISVDIDDLMENILKDQKLFEFMMEEESRDHRKPWLWWEDVKVMCAVGICIGVAWGATWAR